MTGSLPLGRVTVTLWTNETVYRWKIEIPERNRGRNRIADKCNAGIGVGIGEQIQIQSCVEFTKGIARLPVAAFVRMQSHSHLLASGVPSELGVGFRSKICATYVAPKIPRRRNTECARLKCSESKSEYKPRTKPYEVF